MTLVFSLTNISGRSVSFARLSYIHRCSRVIRRAMSVDNHQSPSNTTHLQRTENSPRQEILSEAIVTEISQISTTVKSLSLKVQNKEFTFKCGQWVDFFVPGLSTVGGFSLCSTAKLLHHERQLKLAIKFSDHPPAFWVHRKCKVGDKVLMKVGGNFFYDPPTSSPICDNLLLIAGGVGINPLYSIVQHVSDLCEEPGLFTGKSCLLFSASSNDELLFEDSLSGIAAKNSKISCKYFVTSKSGVTGMKTENSVQSKRISEQDIAEVLSDFDKEKLLVFLCGPPPMIQDMLVHLEKLGVPSDRTRYEKWW